MTKQQLADYWAQKRADQKENMRRRLQLEKDQRARGIPTLAQARVRATR